MRTRQLPSLWLKDCIEEEEEIDLSYRGTHLDQDEDVPTEMNID